MSKNAMRADLSHQIMEKTTDQHARIPHIGWDTLMGAREEPRLLCVSRLPFLFCEKMIR